MTRTRDEGGLRRAARAVVACLVAVAILASGCGLIEGVGDFHVAGPTDAMSVDAMDAQPPLDGAAGPDGSTMPESSTTMPESSTSDAVPSDDAPPAGDGSVDSAIAMDSRVIDTGTDAPVGPVDGCVPTGPEICTDGIDNDCNGLVDCADPACRLYTCMAEPPSWTLVAFSASARSACPASTGPATDLLVDPSVDPYTCTCGCNVATPPSCTTGTLALYDGPMCTLPLSTPANGGGCFAHQFGLDVHLLDPLPPTGGTCASDPVATPPARGTAGESCPLTGPIGGGCDAGEGCVLAQTAPFAGCVAQPGAMACPPGFATAHTAGASLTDTRGCAACGACGTPAATCGAPELSFYSDLLCTILVGTLPADGMCDPTSFMAESYEYSATVEATCAAVAPAAPTGTAALAGPMTVCCP